MSNLRNELSRIYNEMGGMITPEAVVSDAERESSPLHNLFEWDDEVAGGKYRLIQAAELIRSVRVTYADGQSGPRKVREYVSEWQCGAATSGVYKRTADVVRNDLSYTVLLQQMRREIDILKRRYGHLEEFAATIREAAA